MINFYINSITFFVEFLITLTILMNGYPVRKNIGKTILWGLLSFSAFFCLYYFVGNTLLNLISTFVVVFAFSFAGFKTTLKESVVNSISISAIEIMSEFICMSMFSSVGDMELLNTDLNYFVVWTVASKIIYLFLGAVLIRFFKRLKNRRLHEKTNSPIYLFIYPLFAVFAIFVYWIALANNDLTEMTKICISASVVLLLIAVISTYVFYAYTEERNYEINKLQNELEKVLIEKEYYDLLEYQSENIRRLAHDEKSHLLAIKGMSDNEKINNYIDQIYDDLKKYSISGFSSDKQIDVMLNRYKIQCDAENIIFETDIGVADFSKLSEIDIVSLISNILNNAIESARDSKEKHICLSMNKTIGSNALICVNSCDKPPKSVNDKLITTKQDKKNHGYGTRIIEDIVNKYDGFFSWHYEEEKKEFIVTIAL